MKANSKRTRTLKIEIQTTVLIEIEDVQTVLAEYRDKWCTSDKTDPTNHEISMIDMALIAEDLDLISNIEEYDSDMWGEAKEATWLDDGEGRR
jgi:hypothetical protein